MKSCKCDQCNARIPYGNIVVRGLYETKFCSFKCFVEYFEPSVVTPDADWYYDEIMSGEDSDCDCGDCCHCERSQYDK